MKKTALFSLGGIAFFLGAGLAQAQLADPTDLPNFHEVVPQKIYRGGQPSPLGIQELAKMGIRTVVDIRDEDPTQLQKEKKLVEQLGMKPVFVPLSPFATPDDQKVGYLENTVLTDPSLQPIFIHCHYGEDRTGVVIGLYRVFKGTPVWSPQKAYNEMLSLGFHPDLKNFANYYFEKTQWHPFSGYPLELDLGGLNF